MKKIVLLFFIFSTFPLLAQSNNLLLSGSLGSIEYNNQDVYQSFQKRFGLSKRIYSLALTFKRDIEFMPFISQAGITFQYFPKNYYKENIPITSEDFPDGNGLYDEYTADIYVYSVGVILLHKFQVTEIMSVMIGPTIGYGIYVNKLDLGQYESTENYKGIYYNFSGGVEINFIENYFINLSASYDYFNPDVRFEDSTNVLGDPFRMDKIDGIKISMGVGIFF